jgi:hypothetical protein
MRIRRCDFPLIFEVRHALLLQEEDGWGEAIVALARHEMSRATRYYATAFLRETDENRELMRAYMGITGSILALLDRDGLDDRSMMTGVRRSSSNTASRRGPSRMSPGTAASTANVPWWLGSRVRASGRSSAARARYGQRRRGWRARRDSRWWRRTTAKALSCVARGDSGAGWAREPRRSSASSKT